MQPSSDPGTGLASYVLPIESSQSVTVDGFTIHAGTTAVRPHLAQIAREFDELRVALGILPPFPCQNLVNFAQHKYGPATT